MNATVQPRSIGARTRSVRSTSAAIAQSMRLIRQTELADDGLVGFRRRVYRRDHDVPGDAEDSHGAGDRDDPRQAPVAGEDEQHRRRRGCRARRGQRRCVRRGVRHVRCPLHSEERRAPNQPAIRSRKAAAATNGAKIRNRAIAMLIIPLTVARRRPSAVDRRSAWRSSTPAARASNPPMRGAGDSTRLKGVSNASSPSPSVTSARVETVMRSLGECVSGMRRIDS